MSALHSSTPARAARFPLAEADLCVKCGLCLPHCPTYLQAGHEADSPRGRIALLQAQAQGILHTTPVLEAHIDGCLACRACERVCPAQVPFGKLLDQGRANLAAERPARTRRDRLIGFFLTRRGPRTLLRALLRAYQRSGLQSLVRVTRLLGSGRLARYESLLPASVPHTNRSAAPARPHETVQLFTGCAGELLDAETLADCTSMLQALGVRVEIPADQVCCGALHQHAGEMDQARKLSQHNVRAFNGTAPVLFAASGCGAGLRDYPALFGDEARSLSARTQDVSAYLLAHWRETLSLRPLPLRVAIHTPCTLRNVVGGADSVARLLAKIPQIELLELDAQQACCGAAGSLFITQPRLADALIQPKLDAAQQLQPDLIVSSNIGCTLHLAAALRRAGLRVSVLHPVTLLARQLAG